MKELVLNISFNFLINFIFLAQIFHWLTLPNSRRLYGDLKKFSILMPNFSSIVITVQYFPFFLIICILEPKVLKLKTPTLIFIIYFGTGTNFHNFLFIVIVGFLIRTYRSKKIILEIVFPFLRIILRDILKYLIQYIYWLIRLFRVEPLMVKLDKLIKYFLSFSWRFCF